MKGKFVFYDPHPLEKALKRKEKKPEKFLNLLRKQKVTVKRIIVDRNKTTIIYEGK